MDGISSSGRFRYGDIRLPVGVEVRVWESISSPERNFVSARLWPGGSWATLGTIPLGEGEASAYRTLPDGRFRYSDITLTVGGIARRAAPSPTATATVAPTASPEGTPAPTPTATPTPSASDLAAQCSFDDTLPTVRAATVQVESYTRHTAGTAFHIGGGEFITTAHGVTEGERVTLTADGGYRSYAVVVERGDYVDGDRRWEMLREDVALLHAAVPARASLDWAIDETGDDDWHGDAVAVVGHTWGSVQRVAHGVIDGHWLDEGRVLNVAITSARAPAQGNSGSPIVDACGAVRGMLTGGRAATADSAASVSGPDGAAIVASLDLGRERENVMLARRSAVPAPVATPVPEYHDSGAPSGGGTPAPAPAPSPAPSNRAAERAALVEQQQAQMFALGMLQRLEADDMTARMNASADAMGLLLGWCITEEARLQAPRYWIQLAQVQLYCRNQGTILLAESNQLQAEYDAMVARHEQDFATLIAQLLAELAEFDAQE